MPVFPIHLYGQPSLRRKAKVVRTFDDDLRSTVAGMFETMRNAGGIGLAGNQVGLLQRVIVMDLSEMEEWKDVPPLVVINPEVVEEDGQWVMEEGCLSIPDVRDDVERAESVRVRYRDNNFKEQEITATGLLGRVFLHEIDHLNGVLFIDHLSASKQKLLRGRLNKIARGESEVRYPAVPSRALVESE
jgi:peptide deformylase